MLSVPESSSSVITILVLAPTSLSNTNARASSLVPSMLISVKAMSPGPSVVCAVAIVHAKDKKSKLKKCFIKWFLNG